MPAKPKSKDQSEDVENRLRSGAPVNGVRPPPPGFPRTMPHSGGNVMGPGSRSPKDDSEDESYAAHAKGGRVAAKGGATPKVKTPVAQPLRMPMPVQPKVAVRPPPPAPVGMPPRMAPPLRGGGKVGGKRK